MPDPTTTTAPTEPSMGDLKAMLSASEPAAEAKPAEPAKVETSEEPKPAEPEGKKPEAASEPAETKQLKTDDDEPLPESVQKRIAKEAERAARAQAAIDKAVSERKAKEAEAAKLGKSGSEPAPNTAPEATKPVRPRFGEKENETWAQFQDRQAKFDTDHEAWIKAETERTVTERLRAEDAKAKTKAVWDQAVKDHGAEFPEVVERVRVVAPEGLQLAISQLEDWPAMAVHLDKNPDTLKELAETFGQNQIRAIAKLGRIEAGLKSAATVKAQAAAKPLPEPPATPGGKAAASTDFNWETASMSALKKQVAKIRGK